MKWSHIVPAMTIVYCVFVGPLSTQANDVFFDPQLLIYGGKPYGGVQDPEYVSYDQTLRDYMVKRIKHRFGVELDPKKYSGFDLLEIESFFECKKSDEPFDLFLRMFPKQP